GALLFEVCGKAGEVNAAVTLLAYAPTLAVGDWSNSKVVTGRDFRLGEEELQSHFGVLRISAHAGCGSASELGGGREAEQVLELSALLDDVETQVTVVAHCAERCHLLDRLAVSFREVYARIPIIATCECAEEEAGCAFLRLGAHRKAACKRSWNDRRIRPVRLWPLARENTFGRNGEF
ncbi:unnamed protein product, partial [Polarella glacialis]